MTPALITRTLSLAQQQALLLALARSGSPCTAAAGVRVLAWGASIVLQPGRSAWDRLMLTLVLAGEAVLSINTAGAVEVHSA